VDASPGHEPAQIEATAPSPPSLPAPVAFVLGGGGSFGAIQVGMLQALAELELAPDLVVGASVGGEILTATRIEDLKPPFAAIATDLATGKEVRLESGPLVPALLANSVVPGLYPHVRVDGRDPRRRPPCVTWSSTSSPR
jgi:predicted acylesterase/phospholipase RssA